MSPSITHDKRHLELLYDYAKKKIKRQINHMELTAPDGKKIGEANGYLDIDQKERLSIYIVGSDVNPMDLMKRMTSGRTGGYNLDEKKIIANGVLENGLKFESSPMDISRVSIGDSDILTPTWINFSSEEHKTEFSRLTLTSQERNFLPPNIPNIYVRDEHKYQFPTKYAYLEIDGSQYDMRWLDNLNYISTTRKQDSESEQTIFENCLLLALSYASGTKINRLGIYETGPIHKTRLLKSWRDMGNTMFAPIPMFDGKMGYEMIPILQQYFLKERNKDLDAILEQYLLVPVPMDPGGSRSLIVCVLLEGIINFLLTNPKYTLPKDPDFKTAKKGVVQFLKSNEECIRIFKERKGINIIQAERLAIKFAQMQPMSLSDKLVHICNTLSITIHDEEKKVFKDTRNRLAHGTFGHPYEGTTSEAQIELDNLGLLCNLFNKIILCAAGYQGEYQDYNRENRSIKTLATSTS